MVQCLKNVQPSCQACVNLHDLVLSKYDSWRKYQENPTHQYQNLDTVAADQVHAIKKS